jgi:hypothetical protein
MPHRIVARIDRRSDIDAEPRIGSRARTER